MTRKALTSSKSTPRRRRTEPRTEELSRRRFVTMVAAGSAVLLARPGRAHDDAAPQAAAKTSEGAARKTSALSAATQKEFDRQRAGMLATLKTLRDAPLPPGGDLPVVFQPRARKPAPRRTGSKVVR